jgi:sugar phosphate isomerase/epimerase
MGNKLKAAWIGFMNRESKDPWASFKRYAEIGYRGMDMDLSFFPGDRDENFKKFSDMGLKCLCTWTRANLAEDKEALKKVVDNAHYYGYNCVNLGNSSVISSFGEGYGHNGTYEQLMADIDKYNQTVKALADEGLTPVYHNHYQEFTVNYNGVSVMDMFLQLIDPRFKLKLDVGWVYVGGVDPVSFMEKAKDRIELLHIKDFTEQIQPRYLVNSDKETDFGFCAAGTGKLDLHGILAKASEMGIEYAIVEQDRMRNLSMEDSLLCAYLNMKETGYLE